jgi:crotonobetainyl-CoA:carnitine CoA-transferase CaiB-like acyl-CoA transferase
VLTGRFACYNVYETADGRYLAVGALEPKFWANLCNAAGCADLISDQYAPEPRQGEIKSAMATRFRSAPLNHWWTLLREVECCVTPVRTLEEVLSDAHFRERPVGLIPRLSDTPGAVGGAAPGLGEHNEVVLGRIRGTSGAG